MSSFCVVEGCSGFVFTSLRRADDKIVMSHMKRAEGQTFLRFAVGAVSSERIVGILPLAEAGCYKSPKPGKGAERYSTIPEPSASIISKESMSV